MATRRKPKPKPKITLPPFTWETHATPLGGAPARLARPDLEEADIDAGCERRADGEVIANRARVWRTRLPPVMANLNPASRAAVLDYAEAFEAVGASVGTCDPTGGGGGGGASAGPSLRALTAAERLRHMNAALAGAEMVVPVKDARRLRRGDGMARVAFRALAEWVAVEGLSRTDILRRAGAATSNETAMDAATLAIVAMAERLAICCGYAPGATRTERLRNMPGPCV
jgi:hypothetical protein